jgi:D-alanine-D-alanine ligase
MKKKSASVTAKKKIKVGLLFGGKSGEHEVSVVSARSVAAVMDKNKYEIIPIHITKAGQWLGSPASHKVLGTDYEALLKAQSSGQKKSTLPVLAKVSEQFQFAENFSPNAAQRKIDVVFPVLHGTNGEDGTLQGLLEMMNVPYVGSGVLASALAMDKAMAKVHFQAAGLNVGKYLVVMRHAWEADEKKTIATIEKEIKYPAFVKPANSGSSVGISKAHDRAELVQAMRLAALYDHKLLIEAAIDARELEVAVLGNDEPIASVVGEVTPSNEFYDFEAKYVKGDSKIQIPAELPKALAEKVRALAIVAYKSIDCEGMSRVDFFLERKTGKVFINEINSIPGFTSISMYPKMFAASGLAYDKLIDKLIGLALKRHADRSRNRV